MQYWVADLPSWPILPLFPEAVGFIDEAIAAGGCVLIHWYALPVDRGRIRSSA